MVDPRCQLRVLRVVLRVLPMQTRIPFRYGMAELRALPHLFVEAEVEVNGQGCLGLTSEGLPPKWFIKNPRTTVEQDLTEMLAVIQNAIRLSMVHTRSPVSFFALWQTLQAELANWGSRMAYPPLLWQFGVSLVERAILDAIGKQLQLPLHAVIRGKYLGVDWGFLHPGLEGHSAEDFLPSDPLPHTAVRHTVGLADPIRTADISAEQQLHDGLPQSLEECITTYGLRYFKIKVSGDPAGDQQRLAHITSTLQEYCGDQYAVTLDGNEQYRDMIAFREAYTRWSKDDRIMPLLARTLWVEQPLHRDKTLLDIAGAALRQWSEAPAMIIDESDGVSGAAQKALKLGYVGVSHKNCKGILKGLANAAFVHHHRRLFPKKQIVISGEDLANVGPVALTQDLAMQALLGVTHVERNGHHYFRGLSMYPQEIAAQAVEAHPDLYQWHPQGFATLRIVNGHISLKSVNEAPFGCGVVFDLEQFPTLQEWIMRGGLAEVT